MPGNVSIVEAPSLFSVMNANHVGESPILKSIAITPNIYLIMRIKG